MLGCADTGLVMRFHFLLIASLASAASLAAAEPADSEEKEPSAKEPLSPPKTLAFPVTEKCEEDEKKDPGADCKESPQPPATPFDTLAFPALDPPEEGDESDPPDEDGAHR